MKKKINMLVMSVLLSGSILLSTSCIGSFSLWNKLLSWNHTVGEDKFVNELIFVALHIVPVYEIAYFVDILVLNSIEFWTGDNPVNEASIQTIKGEDGIYTVEKNHDGYHIQKEGSDEVVEFIFNEEDKTWNVGYDGESYQLLKVINENEVIMYLPDRKEMPVSLNEAGVLAFKQIASNQTYFASR